jgi:TolA-binding protein
MTVGATAGSGVVAEKKSRIWVVVYAVNIVLFFVLLILTIISGRRPQSKEAKLHEIGIPAFIRDAPASTGYAPQNIARAEQLLSGGDYASALRVLGSVIKSDSDRPLRGQALLMAGIAIATRSDHSDVAIQTFSYYVTQFPDQPGIPNAEYQLALLYLEKGRFDKAQTLLTKILRDFPNNAVSSSAAYLAAQSAETMEHSNSEANRRVGSVVSDLLPSQSVPLGTYIAAFLTTIVSTYLSNREKIHKGHSITVICVLVLAALATYTAFVNVRSRQDVSRALVTSAAEDGKR